MLLHTQRYVVASNMSKYDGPGWRVSRGLGMVSDQGLRDFFGTGIWGSCMNKDLRILYKHAK